jgi:hypothetical protein
VNTIVITGTMEIYGHIENRGEYEVFIIDEQEDN